MNKFEFPETAPKAEPLEGACNCSESAGFLENLLTASRKTLIWRGCIFIVLGILIMLRPVPAIAIIVMLSGIYAIIEGAYALLYSMRMPQRLRALPVLTSILIILLGTAAISFPWIMGEYAIIFWGIWLLLSGFQKSQKLGKISVTATPDMERYLLNSLKGSTRNHLKLINTVIILSFRKIFPVQLPIGFWLC